jgi:hypothetical protein
MFVIEDRVGGLGALVRVRGELFDVSSRRRMARVVMVIAVGMGHGMMCARSVVLQLVGVILSQCGVEVLLLVCSSASLSR